MGHVARCIPLIDHFVKNGNQVYFAGDSEQQRVMRQYFPSINYIEHEGYPFKFSGSGTFRWDFIKQLPELIRRWRKERLEVETICREKEIDIVISDHRYAFRSEKTHSIFVTHQLHLPLRWFERPLQFMHGKWISRFDEVWIVDDEQMNFAGKLSRPIDVPKVSYIGILSRFSLYVPQNVPKAGKVIIVSGPPAVAKNYALEQAAIMRDDKVTIIVPSEVDLVDMPGVNIVRSTDWKACDQLILKAELIISRSGYSTLMDLLVLKTPFSITPTPGQSEQEYLFKLWGRRMKG